MAAMSVSERAEGCVSARSPSARRAAGKSSRAILKLGLQQLWSRGLPECIASSGRNRFRRSSGVSFGAISAKAAARSGCGSVDQADFRILVATFGFFSAMASPRGHGRRRAREKGQACWLRSHPAWPRRSCPRPSRRAHGPAREQRRVACAGHAARLPAFSALASVARAPAQSSWRALKLQERRLHPLRSSGASASAFSASFMAVSVSPAFKLSVSSGRERRRSGCGCRPPAPCRSLAASAGSPAISAPCASTSFVSSGRWRYFSARSALRIASRPSARRQRHHALRQRLEPLAFRRGG